MLKLNNISVTKDLNSVPQIAQKLHNKLRPNKIHSLRGQLPKLHIPTELSPTPYPQHLRHHLQDIRDQQGHHLRL